MSWRGTENGLLAVSACCCCYFFCVCCGLFAFRRGAECAKAGVRDTGRYRLHPRSDAFLPSRTDATVVSNLFFFLATSQQAISRIFAPKKKRDVSSATRRRGCVSVAIPMTVNTYNKKLLSSWLHTFVRHDHLGKREVRAYIGSSFFLIEGEREGKLVCRKIKCITPLSPPSPSLFFLKSQKESISTSQNAFSNDQYFVQRRRAKEASSFAKKKKGGKEGRKE